MFNWVEYYEYAKDILSDTGADECSCRVGISRFYYSAYHTAKKYAEQHSIVMCEGGGMHERLWISLGESNNDNARLISSFGNTLKKLRMLSDYNDGHGVDCRDLKNAYRCANQILTLCQVIEK